MLQFELMNLVLKRRKEGHIEYYDRILREEFIVYYFLTNIFCFFAGNDTVTMPRLVIEILWVVLAHCAHSQERIS